MMQCQQCEPLILDYLYGLLDDAEAVAIESHLRECAACAAARNEAARLQGLIARAAKNTFPHVRFDPPAAKPTPPPLTVQATNLSWPLPLPTAAEPTTQTGQTEAPTPALPDSSTTKAVWRTPWLAWIIAASVLLAIPSTVIPVLGVLNRAESARVATANSVARSVASTSKVEKATEFINDRLAESANKLAIAKQVHKGLLAKWVEEEKIAAAHTQTAHKMTVDVFKPAAVQPGAPNEFLLVLHDRGLAANTQVLAEVRDQTDAVIFSQRLATEGKDNRHPLRLPAEAWTKLTPQSELFLVVSSVDDRTKAKTELQDRIRLFGPVYATMLATDRSTYRPGEMVYFRSLTLDRVTFQPPSREQFFTYELQGPHQHPVFTQAVRGGTDLVRVHDGKVEPVLGPDGKPIRGVGCGVFFLPPDLPDGDYTLQLREIPHPGGYPVAVPFMFPITRSIEVRSRPAEAYAKHIGFAAASYSAGETVEAWAEVKLHDQPVPGVEASVVVLADNKPVKAIYAPETGRTGRTNIRFTLPDDLNQGDVRLKVTFKTNPDESIAERVPVIGRNVIVEFFPEGGDPIAGVPCRVYFRATTPAGQPVDIRGTITDGRKVLAQAQTLTDRDQPGANRGIGSFTYTPVLGTPVWLKLESPSGVFAPLLDSTIPIAPAVVAGVPAVVVARTGFLLPKPVADGVAMRVVNPVSALGEPIRVHLQSVGQNRNLIVGAYTRGRLSDTKRISVQSGQAGVVELMANSDPRGGVVRITVFEEPAEHLDAKEDKRPDIKPIAERLVFRKPGEALQLSFKATGTGTGAGAPFAANSAVDVAVTATDEKGKPTAAILWAAAINSGVPAGKKDRLATTHFLLAGEISTPDAMEYADFLLTDHPKAAESLDLVLATQGWRRLVEQFPPKLAPPRRETPTEDQSKFLIANGQHPTQAESMVARDRRKLYEAYWPRYEAATKALVEAQAANDATIAEANEVAHIRELESAARQAQNEANEALEHAKATAEPLERLRGAGWYGIAGFGLLAVMLAALSLARPLSRVPYGIGTAGSLGLVIFLVFALGMSERTEAAIRINEESTKAAQEELEAVHAPAGSITTLGQTDDASNRTRFAHPNIQPHIPGTQDAALGKGNVPPPPGMFGGPPSGVSPLPPLPGAPKIKNGPMQQPGRGPPGGSNNDPLPKPLIPKKGEAGGPPLQATGPSPDRKGMVPETMSSQTVNDGNGIERKTIQDWELGSDKLMHSLALRRGTQPEGQATAELLKRTNDKARDYATDRLNLLRSTLETLRKSDHPAETQAKQFGSQGMVKNAEHDPITDMAYSWVKSAVPTVTPLVVREYAAPRPSSDGVDAEIPDTILWQPVIVLPNDGKATLTLQLGTAKGGYQVMIAGHTLDGRIGAIRGTIPVSPQSVQPATPAPIPPTMP